MAKNVLAVEKRTSTFLGVPLVETAVCGGDEMTDDKKTNQRMNDGGVPDKAKVIQVIRVEAIRGEGTDDDPVRRVYQYWSFQGALLAENDTLYDILEARFGRNE